MPLQRRKIIQNLTKKGFTEIGDGDHIVLRFEYRGVKTFIRTKISRGSKYKEISEKLIAQMARQCRINKTEFVGLVECTVSQRDYIDLLDEKMYQRE